MGTANEKTIVLTNELLASKQKLGPFVRPKRKRSNILGFEVDRMTLDECVHYAEQAILSRRQLHIVLVNAAKIVKALSDPELAGIIRSADLVGADGVPIVWASRMLSWPLPGRVNGTDLMDRLIELSAEKGYGLYLLGARQNVIERVVKNLKRKYPNIRIVGYRNGYFQTKADMHHAVRKIAQSNADILLVGMGTPMKEKWVRSHIQELGVPVIHGVGGSFDILGGLTKRAPLWMQRYGLEWFYRLMQEPRRLWKRYLVTNVLYIFLVLKEAVKRFFRFRNET